MDTHMGVLGSFNKNTTITGGNLLWPMSDDGPSLPILDPKGASTPLLRQDEMANLPVKRVFHVATFCSWIAEEEAEYREVMDQVVATRFQLIRRFEVYDAEAKGWRSRVEWVEPYKTIPPTSPGGFLG